MMDENFFKILERLLDKAYFVKIELTGDYLDEVHELADNFSELNLHELSYDIDYTRDGVGKLKLNYAQVVKNEYGWSY